MHDREKVISDLEKIADEANPWKESPPLRCDLPYPLLLDALELLKEQEEEIQSLRRENHDILTQFHEWAKEQPQIVRCKDCKYYDSFSQECRNGIDGIMTPEFYCASGERK